MEDNVVFQASRVNFLQFLHWFCGYKFTVFFREILNISFIIDKGTDVNRTCRFFF